MHEVVIGNLMEWENHFSQHIYLLSSLNVKYAFNSSYETIIWMLKGVTPDCHIIIKCAGSDIDDGLRQEKLAKWQNSEFNYII